MCQTFYHLSKVDDVFLLKKIKGFLTKKIKNFRMISMALMFVCEGFSDGRAIARPIKGSLFAESRVMMGRKRKGAGPLEA